jgi:voltage-gated potassium channel
VSFADRIIEREVPCRIHAIKTRLKILLIILFSVMVLGTVGFMVLERTSLLDAAYFVIVTMATVGYGDVHPMTPWGKMFAIVVIVMGVGTFLGVIANVTEIMLAKRDMESRMEKLNMVIGVFFSEVGSMLISRFSQYDPKFDAIRPGLMVSAKWTDKDFLAAGREARNHDYAVAMDRVDLHDLKGLLLGKRGFLVRLLENPVLLEHQSFTDLLRAVFHLAEELACRDQVTDLPQPDRDHLAHDIKRAYHLVVSEWVSYMRYLKNSYPFLFSLAMRTNPVDPKASAIVA